MPLLLALAAVARASPPDPAATTADAFAQSWRWVRFGVAEGLPTPSVGNVIETPGGTAWVGCANGVAWYDGFAWHAVTTWHGEPLGEVAEVQATEDEHVWVRTVARMYYGDTSGFEPLSFPGLTRDDMHLAAASVGGGQVLVLLRRAQQLRLVLAGPGRAQDVPLPDSTSRDQRLKRLDSGRVVLLDMHGASTWTGGHFEPIPADSGTFQEIAENPAGDGAAVRWWPIPGLGLWTWTASSPLHRDDTEGGMRVDHVAVARSGDVLVLHDTSEVRLRHEGSWTSLAPPPEPLRLAVALRYRSNGDLWVATPLGLFLFRGSSSRWTSYPSGGLGSPASRVHALAVSVSGQVVAATAGGLQVYEQGASAGPVPPLPIVRPLEPTCAVFDDEGRLCVGSGGSFAGIYILEDGKWRLVEHDDQGDSLGLVHVMRRDARGRTWLLSAAATTQDSARWDGSIHVLEKGKLSGFAPATELGAQRFYDFAEEADGTLWIGAVTGLWRYAGARWTRFDHPVGSGSAAIFALAADPAGGVWAGSNVARGLFHVDPESRVRAEALPPSLALPQVWGLLAESSGQLWVATPRGLGLRLPDGTWTSFGPDDGLEPPVAWPLLRQGRKLLVGTRGGGCRVLDLDSLAVTPPRVGMGKPEVWNDTFRVSWQPQPAWGDQEPAHVPTRWRLDGGAWSGWSDVRECAASALAQGSHVVEVQARNLLGDTGPITSLRVPVSLPIWRRRSVLAAAGLVLLVPGVMLAVMGLRRRRDLRTLRLAQEAAQRSQARLGAVLDAHPDIFLQVDSAGRITYMNARARDLARAGGREPQTLLGADLADALPADVSSEAVEAVRSAARERRTLDLDVWIQSVRAWFALRATPGADALDLDLREVTAARHEADQRVAHERRLAEIQRHESLALLAGGVAHDFNNLLAVMLGHAQLAGLQLPPGHVAAEHLEDVVTAARRAAELTQQLLDQSGHVRLVRRRLDLNGVVRDAADAIRAALPPGSAVTLRLADDLPQVEADGARLRQVLLRLVSNASEAIGGGAGRVSIETACREEGAQRFVALSVEDDGCGMDAETMRRAFEPFFTTHAPGRGLGLAAVQGIVESHGGRVLVESEVGRGTRVTVTLPVAAAVAADLARAPVEIPPAGQAGLVLVVDDEPLVLRAATMLLRAAGHEAVAAEGPRQALEQFARRAGDFGAALIDVTMPEMDGVELSRRLRAIRPDLAVALVSGHAEEDVLPRVTPEGFAFVQKPFSAATLLAALAEARARAPKAGAAGASAGTSP